MKYTKIVTQKLLFCIVIQSIVAQVVARFEVSIWKFVCHIISITYLHIEDRVVIII